MWELKEYLAGLLFGWTWVELSANGQPLPSGRRFFTEKGAATDWRRTRDRRGLACPVDLLVCIRRPYVDAWLDGWRVGDQEHRPVLLRTPRSFG